MVSEDRNNQSTGHQPASKKTGFIIVWEIYMVYIIFMHFLNYPLP